ncbi:methyl-accepting chemotaxis protein [Marinomonas ostreistagni]|uniref:methyl-accepting chemotaxis protein n=1 Tax=Marinomonas ostreistagni TaxID=359209 RepID=UPI0019510986|nr:methyl-accepting chemotaxis protein [Marinomonas ostreistagni]MBM6550093.1 PAS domain S-box protein [Marinomonas ostreistagni]
MLSQLFSKKLDDNQVIVDKAELANLKGQLAALSKSQAVIEFDTKGNILFANENFLQALGYSLDEVQGKHHAIFVDQKYRASQAYKDFWQALAKGDYQAGEFCRYTKAGDPIWIEASYNPVFDEQGNIIKIVKFATDVTERKNINADYESQLDAISKSQAVISFELDGTIIEANDNFLNAVGYRLDEVRGRHHSIFVDETYRQSEEYRTFWRRLGQGEHFVGRFPRVRKDGKTIWIQANYSPIRDSNGRLYKVVKYASDITAQVEAEQEVQRTVEEVNDAIAQAINNDLTARVTTHGKSDTMLSISKGVNDLLEAMSAIIQQIREASEAVYVGAKEISHGNTDLSTRTEEQASSLEETASSMELLTETVRQNSSSAHEATGLAKNAVRVARDGGDLIDKVVVTMNDINQSSQKISDIIGMIDGIAFQTNILALNAAVEAARAGEQGRGFAVVASEVRTLAQRSANAAKDIKDLISESSSKIEDGNQLVDQSGETMREIVAAIAQVNDIMSTIASASSEQSDNLLEIGKAVSQMDQMTQQNAALVEEAAASSENLLSQADRLASNVNKFKIDNTLVRPSLSSHKVTEKRQEPVQAKPSQPISKPKAIKPPVAELSDDDEWEEF